MTGVSALMTKGHDFSPLRLSGGGAGPARAHRGEAIPLVEEFLNDAYSRGWCRVRIVHGKGTGTLRLEVDRFLSRNSLVSRHGPADRYHGGSGATEVELGGR